MNQGATTTTAKQSKLLNCKNSSFIDRQIAKAQSNSIATTSLKHKNKLNLVGRGSNEDIIKFIGANNGNVKNGNVSKNKTPGNRSVEKLSTEKSTTVLVSKETEHINDE